MMAGFERVSDREVGDELEQSLELDDLFRRYAPYVAKIGYRLLGRDDEVDDLVQDVFLAAHRGLSGLRKPEAIKGWLATIAVRRARKKLRRRKMLTAIGLGGHAEYEDVADRGASPEEKALVGQVYRVLDRIPIDHRVAWTLRYIQGESLERVAELAGCSLATAKRRIKAAREAITEEVPHG